MSSGEYGQRDGAGRLLAGRYRVLAQLGRGGMGVVWRARDEVLGREVAVKELRTYIDADGPELDALRLRMQREARAAARVRHSAVVAVHDVTEVDGRPLIVMELVDGPSLDDVIRERGGVDPYEAAAIGAEVMDALAAAHRAGVLHRDVKPGNILLDRSGRVVLTDFGIATMEDPGDGSATHLTRSGELVGSLDYLAPERARGADPGPASDVWALGATLYAAVEGTAPFRRTSAFATLTAIVSDPLPDQHRTGPLGPVLRRLMEKGPEARPGAEEARELLRRVAESGGGDRPTTTVRGPAATASPDRTATESAAAAVPREPEPPTPPLRDLAHPADREGAVGPPGGPGAARRRGRVLLASAAVAALLTSAAVTAVLLDNADGTGTSAAPPASSSPRTTKNSGAAGDEPTGKDDDGTPSPKSTPTPTPTPTSVPGTDVSACHPIGGGRYNCEVSRTAKSYTADGAEVGILRAGTNYFYCQANLGRRETYREWTNVWWAKTDDDSGNSDVYVSDVYVRGGDNDEPVPGLPVC
ncbi:serine/threonine-protein kinase [Streptomyces sp. NPDC058867]|uniref:serine/threonine-protein kinase n=1 Tax=unclassified Streptomyces TaxID=2593676 RepID=UPI0036A0FBBA